MISGQSRLRATVIVVSAILILAACGSTTSSKTAGTSTAGPVAVHTGDCFAKEIPDMGDVAPDFTTAVACTKPHIYEISNVINVPQKFLRGSTKKAKLANRKVLGSIDSNNKLAEDLGTFAFDECRDSIFKLAGVKHIRIAGKSLKQVGAQLTMGGAEGWLNLSPAKAWTSGQRQVICSVRYTKHIETAGDIGPDPISAASDHPAFYDFLTPEFPTIRRQCVTYDTEDRYNREPCTKHHYGEIFFSYDAAKAFGEKFVKGVNIDDPSVADLKKLDEPCYDALPALIGNNLDEDLSAVSDLGDAGWYDEDTVYTTYCMGTPYDSENFDLPAGSLVENPSNVHFVKIAAGQGA